MRILIIDDDCEGVEYISTFLQLEGFTVHCATTGREGLALMCDLCPDLVMLDVRLPDIVGWDLCRQIRRFSNIPILMFSAYDKETQHEVQGLTLGADGYLVKPVEFELLKAHVMALLRRGSMEAAEVSRNVYIDSYLMIDIARRQVIVQGRNIILSSLEYELLKLLVFNYGDVLPIVELTENLWPNVPEDEAIGYVRTYVSRLRAKIEPDPKEPCYIINDYGLGYRFQPS